ncbi:MAG: hypothetical protein RMJ43_13820 [Chloroherpetonaceae bacterium]|nr:hypothetical protein [Chthonomonadaceae bacterium]MDW8208907.1 hypothetical protein [Chloroherpetonaceae bacterium]
MARRSQRWFRAFLLVVGGTTALCMILVPWIGRRMLQRDYAESVLHEGIGTVVMLVDQRVDIARGEVYQPKVIVRFRGAAYPVRSVAVTDYPRLRIGQSVRILYRVGRMGRLYVETVEPVAPETHATLRRK